MPIYILKSGKISPLRLNSLDNLPPFALLGVGMLYAFVSIIRGLDPIFLIVSHFKFD
jgi:hypothetical protein